MSTTPAVLPDQPFATPRRVSLRSNFAWTLAGNVVYAGCQWGVLVSLARLGTPEIVGTFALGLAITAPVIFLTNLDLRAVQATDSRHEYQFGDYLGLRLLTTVVAMLIVSGIVLAAGYPLGTAAVILLVGLAKGFEAVSDILYGLMQQQERMDRISLSLMIRGTASLVLIAAVVLLTGSLLAATAALAIAWAAILLLFDLPGAAHVLADQGFGTLCPRWQPTTLARLGRLALPLGAVMFLISLNTNIPRYFVEHYLGLRDLGIFSALAYLTVAGSTVGLALGHAAYPRLARDYADGKRRQYTLLLIKMLGVALVLGLGGILLALMAGRPLLELLYGPAYAEQTTLLVLVMIAAAVSYLASMLNFGMTAARYFTVQAPLYLGLCLVTLVASSLLVPAFGLPGAALALVAGSTCQLLGAGLILAVILTRKEAT